MKTSLFLIFLVLTQTLACLPIRDCAEFSANGFVVGHPKAILVGDSVEGNQTLRHTNLLGNPGFEEELKGWSLKKGHANITVDDGTSHSGQKSLRIDRSEYGYGYASQTIYINSTESPRSFLVSAWARSREATADKPFFDLLVGVLYEDGTAEDFDVEFSHGTHGWENRLMFFSVNASKRLEYVQIFVRFQDQAGTVWFDDTYFAWIDTYVQVQCVDEASQSVANASVRVFDGLTLLEEEQTDDDGRVYFLLPSNKTFTVTVFWIGLLVAKEYVSVTQDVELLFSCDITTEMREVTLLLSDFIGQRLSDSDVEVLFRPLTSAEDFSLGQFLTSANGAVECLLPQLTEWFEITVLLSEGEDLHRARMVTTLNPNTSIEMRFNFVKLGGRYLSPEQFALYILLAVFTIVATAVISHDIYRLKKLTLIDQSNDESERRIP